MNKYQIYIGILFILLILLTGCAHHSYVSRVPALNHLSGKYLETENKVLVLPLWHRLASWAHEGYEPLGYYYFGEPFIVDTKELNKIHNIIPSKTSSGMITPAAATGKWEKFIGLYLIFDNGSALYMQTKDTNSLYPTDSWAFTNHSLIGPGWRTEIIDHIQRGGDIAYSKKHTDFFWAQKSLMQYTPAKVRKKPTIIKNKLSPLMRQKIIAFLEDINNDSRIIDIDTWKSRAYHRLTTYNIKPKYNAANGTVTIDTLTFEHAKQEHDKSSSLYRNGKTLNRSIQRYKLNSVQCRSLIYDNLNTKHSSLITQSMEDKLKYKYIDNLHIIKKGLPEEGNCDVIEINNLKFYKCKKRFLRFGLSNTYHKSISYFIGTLTKDRQNGYSSVTALKLDKTCFDTLLEHFKNKALKDGIEIKLYSFIDEDSEKNYKDSIKVTKSISIKIKKEETIYSGGKPVFKVKPGDTLTVLREKVCLSGEGICWEIKNDFTQKKGFVNAQKMYDNQEVNVEYWAVPLRKKQ